MPATTIAEVLAQLEQIIANSRRDNNRIGIFAALYYKVTDRVRIGIEKNEFQDGARMERLDVIFANRYLTALEQWQSGQRPSASWLTAFEASRKSSALILQHLLLGINAHINLDLGIAAVETMKDGNFRDIESDFDSINTIISSLTYEVINDINRMSPLISLIGLHSGRTESIFIQFSISNARDGAWCFAEDLNKTLAPASSAAASSVTASPAPALSPAPASSAAASSVTASPAPASPASAYDEFILKRDKSIDILAGAMVHFKGTLRFTLWLIHLFEWKDPARIIGLLHDYKKTYITVNKTTPPPPRAPAENPAASSKSLSK